MNDEEVPAKNRNPKKQNVILGTDDVDLRPSRTPMRVIDAGKQLIFRMDVLGEGTMEMVVTGNPLTGRLKYEGMRICQLPK